MKQVYILSEFNVPRAVFTRRGNADALVDALVDALGTGFSVRAIPIVDSDGTSIPVVPDDYEGEVDEDGADA